MTRQGSRHVSFCSAQLAEGSFPTDVAPLPAINAATTDQPTCLTQFLGYSVVVVLIAALLVWAPLVLPWWGS